MIAPRLEVRHPAFLRIPAHPEVVEGKLSDRLDQTQTSSHKTNARHRETEVRRCKTDARRRETEVRRCKTNARHRETEVRSLNLRDRSSKTIVRSDSTVSGRRKRIARSRSTQDRKGNTGLSQPLSVPSPPEMATTHGCLLTIFLLIGIVLWPRFRSHRAMRKSPWRPVQSIGSSHDLCLKRIIIS